MATHVLASEGEEQVRALRTARRGPRGRRQFRIERRGAGGPVEVDAGENQRAAGMDAADVAIDAYGAGALMGRQRDGGAQRNERRRASEVGAVHHML